MPVEPASVKFATSDKSRSPHGRRLVLITAALILVVEGYVAVAKRQNDFTVHQLFGAQFLAGDPYAERGDWYPLPRIMMNAVIAVGPPRLARGVCYALCLAALAWTVRRWHDLGELRQPLHRTRWFAATTIAGLVLLPYLLRDLDECGLQLFLLFFLTAGAWALHCNKPIQAGFWLATAAAYKSTPILCLPYLLWKRRWFAAAMMTVWLGVWAVAPAAFLGWDKTVAAHEQFVVRTRAVTANRSAYPELPGGIEAPKQQNQCLFAAVARYVETHPSGHPLVIDHPWFVQFGTLDQETAYRFVRGVVLALGLVLAWRFRRSANGESGPSDLPVEWAAVCLFCALTSPLCWKQHLIVAVPAVLLLARSAASYGSQARFHLGALCVVGLGTALMRHGIVGRELSIVLMSYKIDTALMLIVVGLTLSLPRTSSKRATNATIDRRPPAALRAA